MASGKVRVAWASDPAKLADALDDWWLRVERNLANELRNVGVEMVRFAQGAHPWKNRTGEAERGLTYIFSETGDGFKIDFGHTAPHGKWLEYRWAGRWGIVPKTLTQSYPLVMRAVINALRG